MTVGGHLYLCGDGPATASTNLELVVPFRWCYDANGYYASLGIRPDATRREIREAYQRLRGDLSSRLTYIVKQLLDRETRRRYDETPIGSVFLDYEVECWLRDACVRKSFRLRADGRVVEVEEITDDSFTDPLDTGPVSDDDDHAQSGQTVWSWAFYLQDTSVQDRERLSRWQELLVSALGRRGERLHLAVGFSGGMASPWGVLRKGHQTIVFLDDGERPTEALASRVAQHIQSTLSGHKHGDNKMSSNFRKGAEASQEASKGGQFARTQFFNMEDGKTSVVRFLTDADDWIVVDQHQMVPTKGRPDDYPKEARWPEKMGSVCRKDPAFSYGECYICENLVDGKIVKKPGARTWALACLREEVIEDGKMVGLRDVTREVTIPEKDGQAEKKVTEKAIVVVNMGYKNFFSILQGFAGRYHTVLDRDYWIKRSGSGTDTTYQIVPMDPIETDNGRYDLREPEFKGRYKTDLVLEEVISERADDEFYAKFFDRRVTVTSDGKVEKSGQSEQPPAPESDVDEARMAALADRVKGYGAPAEDKPAGEPAAAGGGMRNFS